MGKNQVPRGTTKKERCECGRWFYPVIYGSAMKKTKKCSACSQEGYKKEDKKKNG